MPALTLEPSNYAAIHARLDATTWTVCCLCAAWCDVCTGFRERFEQLAIQHPDIVLLWIDIEDRADMVEEFDVDNFPTLLMQRGDAIFFYGTIEPDAAGISRLITSQIRAEGAAPAGHHALRSKLAAMLALEKKR